MARKLYNSGGKVKSANSYGIKTIIGIGGNVSGFITQNPNVKMELKNHLQFVEIGISKSKNGWVLCSNFYTKYYNLLFHQPHIHYENWKDYSSEIDNFDEIWSSAINATQYSNPNWKNNMTSSTRHPNSNWKKKYHKKTIQSEVIIDNFHEVSNSAVPDPNVTICEICSGKYPKWVFWMHQLICHK